jgi:hypothetical protein
VVTTFHSLRVRGDGIVPGDYVLTYQTSVLHARNDMGTIKIQLTEPSPSGKYQVSIPCDRLIDIERPITERGVTEGL